MGLGDRRQLLWLLVLVAAGVAASLFLQQTGLLGRYVGDAPSANQVLLDEQSPRAEHGEGNLTVVMFTDYRCPACRSADGELHAAVAEDGNIKVIYKEWPIFGKRSEQAAKVALAADRQGIYPPVHRGFMNAPSLDKQTMRQIVEEAGGTWDRIEVDLERDHSQIAAQLADNSHQAMSLGLRGTPGYLIGPFLVEGALSKEEFLRAFERARAERNEG